MGLVAEWTFEGGLEGLFYLEGPTDSATVIHAAHMLVCVKWTF